MFQALTMINFDLTLTRKCPALGKNIVLRYEIQHILLHTQPLSAGITQA